MTTNQEGVHAAVRSNTSTAASYTSDWHKLFDNDALTVAPYGPRLMAWINARLGTSYVNLNQAMQAFAVNQGFNGWMDMNTFTISGAARLLAGETQGLALDFTDMSCVIKDTGTPANAFSGDPNTKLTYTSPSTKWIENSSGVLVSGTTLRTAYLNSVAQGLLVEEARTNLAIWGRDFTNAAWSKTNMTAAKTATGADGSSNGASTLTATAGNATALQSITSGSAARITGCRIRRRTGSGNIQLTQDNGTTWTTVTVTGSYTRVNISAQTLTNPIVGIRIVTSGDEVDVDFFQHEVGSFITSDIETPAGSTVARAVDNISISTSLFPYSSTAFTFYGSAVIPRTPALNCFVALNSGGSYGSGNGALLRAESASQATFGGNGGSVTATVSPSYVAGNVFKAAGAGEDSSNTQKVCGNGGAVTSNTSFDWTGTSTRIQLGSLSSSGAQVANSYIRQIMYLPRFATNAELQTFTT